MNEIVRRATQAVFDAALEHIRKQREPCSDDEGCKYRSGGRMCAFGPAIEYYDPSMEGTSASELLEPEWRDSLYEWARNADDRVVDRIQSAHDGIDDFSGDEFVREFNIRMRHIAEDWNLNYEPEEKVA